MNSDGAEGFNWHTFARKGAHTCFTSNVTTSMPPVWLCSPPDNMGRLQKKLKYNINQGFVQVLIPIPHLSHTGGYGDKKYILVPEYLLAYNVESPSHDAEVPFAHVLWIAANCPKATRWQDTVVQMQSPGHYGFLYHIQQKSQVNIIIATTNFILTFTYTYTMKDITTKYVYKEIS